MGAVVGQFAEIGALWQPVDDIGAAPQCAPVFADALVDQFDRQRREVNARPSPLHAVGCHKGGGAAAEGIEDDVAFVAGGFDNALKQGDGFLRRVAGAFTRA